MLVALTLCLVIASLMILFVKKNRESWLLMGLCVSLALEMCGIMIFIAKKGGVSQDVMQFLYFSRTIQEKIRYLWITLNQLGFLIALGRTLYPFFLLEIALNYSMVSWIRKNHWVEKVIAILPAITLILYYPAVYRWLTARSRLWQQFLMETSFCWLSLYLIASLLFLFWEYHSITMKFCRRQFSQIMSCLVGMTILYCLYFHQDPGQVYHFYSYDFIWGKGIGYLQINPSLLSYTSLVLISVICCVMGFYSLFCYTTGNYEESKNDMVLQRKFNMAKVGVSMFVHGMKNQLLSSKVIYKRIGQLYEQPEVDVVKLKEYIDSLESFNNAMLSRMEELYSCVKSNAIYMVPVSIQEIAENAIDRFHKKYAECEINTELSPDIVILADKSQLCEALYNLLINAQEAVLDADKEDGKVTLRCYNERLYTVIEVHDTGLGMSKTQMKRVFEPFYSNKNSNYNWGMGLYYVREVVKGHLGLTRVESKLNEGSSFYVLLPRYN